MCAGLNEDRFTSLALMHIHYDRNVDLETVVDLFTQMHPRRLKLSSVLFESMIYLYVWNPACFTLLKM